MKSRHLLVGMADQGVVSLTSILVLASAAQSATAHQLGLFAIGLSSVLASVSVTRTLTGESLLVRVTGHPHKFHSDKSIRDEAAKALGLACLIAIATAALIALLAVLWTDARAVLLAATGTTVAVIGQDTVRHVCIARKRITALLFGDLLVMVLSVAMIMFLGQIGGHPHHMLLAWGVACFVGLLSVSLAEGLYLSMKEGIEWLRVIWRSSSAFALEAILGAATGYAIVITLGVLLSPAEVAGYRTTLSVFGLTSVVMNALRTVVMRELTPHRLGSRSGMWRIFCLLSALVFAACMATLVAILAMPTAWGTQAFGQTWPLVVALAPFAALNRLGAGLSVVPLTFLRVQRVTWAATRIRIYVSLLLCFLAPLFASLDGAAGAFSVEAVMYFLVAVLLMRMALRTPPALD